MTTDISLIGVPTDIGAGARGASMGPEALRVAGIARVLETHGLRVLDRGNLAGPANPWHLPTDGYRHLDEVVAWNQTLHDAVLAELDRARDEACQQNLAKSPLLVLPFQSGQFGPVLDSHGPLDDGSAPAQDKGLKPQQ